MERILVTGGGGFIGSHMARYLCQQGNFVRVADIKFDDYIQIKTVYMASLLLTILRFKKCAGTS